MSHTPGPWRLLLSCGKQLFIYAADSVDPLFIYLKTRKWPNKDADLRLIAAAPDLLEACEALDAQWTEDRPEGPDTPGRDRCPEMHETTKAVWRQLRAAIAKAKEATR